jgi:hypothetical protein
MFVLVKWCVSFEVWTEFLIDIIYKSFGYKVLMWNGVQAESEAACLGGSSVSKNVLIFYERSTSLFTGLLNMRSVTAHLVFRSS